MEDDYDKVSFGTVKRYLSVAGPGHAALLRRFPAFDPNALCEGNVEQYLHRACFGNELLMVKGMRAAAHFLVFARRETRAAARLAALVEDLGADVAALNKYDSTPLLRACHAGNRVALLSYLLAIQECRATINLPNENGWTPLHEAAG